MTKPEQMETIITPLKFLFTLQENAKIFCSFKIPLKFCDMRLTRSS